MQINQIELIIEKSAKKNVFFFVGIITCAKDYLIAEFNKHKLLLNINQNNLSGDLLFTDCPVDEDATSLINDCGLSTVLNENVWCNHNHQYPSFDAAAEFIALKTLPLRSDDFTRYLIVGTFVSDKPLSNRDMYQSNIVKNNTFNAEKSTTFNGKDFDDLNILSMFNAPHWSNETELYSINFDFPVEKIEHLNQAVYNIINDIKDSKDEQHPNPEYKKYIKFMSKALPNLFPSHHLFTSEDVEKITEESDFFFMQ